MDNSDLGAKQLLVIPDQEKLEFNAGIDAAQIWTDQLKRRANKLKGSQAKSELVSILSTGKHYEIEWANAEAISAINPSLDEDKFDAVVKARNKQTMRRGTFTRERMQSSGECIFAFIDGKEFHRSSKNGSRLRLQ